MNLAHVHLLLNHFPTIGTLVALSLLLLGMIARSDDLRRASLGIFVALALIAMPTYMSGNAAEEIIRGNEGVSKALIEAHQSLALLAFIVLEFLGVVAWFGLWQHRRDGRMPALVLPVVLVLGAITMAFMGGAASVGGEISHAEIREGAGSVDATVSLFSGTAIKEYVLERTMLWAGAEALHFIGLSMLFGVVLLIDLRMLGLVRSIGFPALHKLLPWAVLGFAINTATGMMFFVAASEQYTTSIVFFWKVAFILIAGANALYFTVVDEAWAVKEGDTAPGRVKLVAMAAVLLWIGVIYCGRMLPFLGNAF